MLYLWFSASVIFIDFLTHDGLRLCNGKPTHLTYAQKKLETAGYEDEAADIAIALDTMSLAEGLRPVPGGPFSALTPSMWPQDILAKLGQPEVIVREYCKFICFCYTIFFTYSLQSPVPTISLTIVSMSLAFASKRKMVPSSVRVNCSHSHLPKMQPIGCSGLHIWNFRITANRLPI